MRTRLLPLLGTRLLPLLGTRLLPLLGTRLLPLLGMVVPLACLEAPPSFEKVDAAAARQLLVDGRAELVSVVEGGDAVPADGGVAWRLGESEVVELESAPQDLPVGGVLVVATNADLGMRLAAALARPRNREVWLFIPASAEERQSVYVVRSPKKENPLGADS